MKQEKDKVKRKVGFLTAIPSGRKRSTLVCGMMKQSRAACAAAVFASSCLARSFISSGLRGVLETLCLGGAPPGGLLAMAVESKLGDLFPGGPVGGGRSLCGPPIGGATGPPVTGGPFWGPFTRGGPLPLGGPWGPFPFMVTETFCAGT